MVEAALIAAVLTPVALSATVRRTLGGLDRPRQLALATMLALAVAGQLALDTRSFPFVNWHMYATVQRGDPTVYEYDAVLRSGRSVPLVPGRFLAPESADRLMEALRRQVERLKPAPDDPSPRAEHERTLGAVAGLYDGEHPDDRVATVVVSQKAIALASGAKSTPTVLWQVRLR